MTESKELSEQERADLLGHARWRWGPTAHRYGLGIVDADEETITVELRLGDTSPGSYLISKLELSKVYVLDWPFEQAARKLKERA